MGCGIWHNEDAHEGAFAITLYKQQSNFFTRHLILSDLVHNFVIGDDSVTVFLESFRYRIKSLRELRGIRLYGSRRKQVGQLFEELGRKLVIFLVRL
jgi:hypothetical protein